MTKRPDPVFLCYYFIICFTYIFLRSLKNYKIYVGYTNKKPEERLLEHNNGSNEWSRHNGPFELLYYESYHCKKDALHREKFYKTGYGRKVRDAILSAVSAKG